MRPGEDVRVTLLPGTPDLMPSVTVLVATDGAFSCQHAFADETPLGEARKVVIREFFYGRVKHQMDQFEAWWSAPDATKVRP